MKHSFSKAEALGFGWRTVKKHLWFFVILMLIVCGISFLTSSLSGYLSNGNDAVSQAGSLLIMIIGWIVNIEVSFGTLAIYLKFVDNKPAELKDLFAYFRFRLLLGYIAVGFLYGMLVLVGFFFLIIPGIYFALKYWFATYAYVDRGSGVLESFRISARLTKGIKWQLLLLGILQALIMLGGLLALLVGYLVAVPINYLSDFYVYRKLQAQE